MADNLLKNPRKKRGSKKLKADSPLPVPIQTITGKTPHDGRWFYFEGILRGYSVAIENPGDMNFLCKMGFFGKGILSRSKPEFEIISDLSQKTITGSERLRRLPPRERQICQSKFRVLRKERFKRHNSWVAMVEERSEHNTSLPITPPSSVASCIPNPEEHTQLKPWDMTARVNNLPELHSRIQTVALRKRTADCFSQTEQPENKRSAKDFLASPETRVSSGIETTVNDMRSVESRMCHVDVAGIEDECEIFRTDTGEQLGSMAVLDVKDCSSKSSLKTDESWNSSSNDDDRCDADCQGISKTANDQEEEETDDEDDNSRVDEDKEEDYERKKTSLSDPYKIYEIVQLSLEESFFLSYGLGCLTVLNPTDEQSLEICDLWKKCCSLKKNFVQSYIAYHYFRSKGWVPKPGIKYGSDWILYKQGMPFYHASYAVLVHLVPESFVQSGDRKPWNWHTLMSHSRVSEHVAKEVLLCFVIKPEDLTQDDMSSPKSITRFKVQEVLMRRWLPERARNPKC